MSEKTRKVNLPVEKSKARYDAITLSEKDAVIVHDLDLGKLVNSGIVCFSPLTPPIFLCESSLV
jgi:hypothetical protein